MIAARLVRQHDMMAILLHFGADADADDISFMLATPADVASTTTTDDASRLFCRWLATNASSAFINIAGRKLAPASGKRRLLRHARAFHDFSCARF